YTTLFRSPASFPNGATLTPQELAADTYCQGWPNCAGNGQQLVIIPSRLLNPNVQQLVQTYFPKISPQVTINPGNGRIADLFQTLVPGGSTRDLGRSEEHTSELQSR